MTDLRQGVTPAQHEALDLIEREGLSWPTDFEERLALGRSTAARATRSTRLRTKRDAAIRAAALFLDAADEMDALIRAIDR